MSWGAGGIGSVVLLSERERERVKGQRLQNFFFEERGPESEQKEVARIQNRLPLAYRSIFLAQSRRRDKQAPLTKATFLHLLGTPRRTRKTR